MSGAMTEIVVFFICFAFNMIISQNHAQYRVGNAEIWYLVLSGVGTLTIAVFLMHFDYSIYWLFVYCGIVYWLHKRAKRL